MTGPGRSLAIAFSIAALLLCGSLASAQEEPAGLLERIEPIRAGLDDSDRWLAAGRAAGVYEGMVFQDSDLYKWLEAVGNLAPEPGEIDSLQRWVDEVVDLIEAAPLDGGYLNNSFIVNDQSKRWSNLRDAHELYCAGHLIEAAVALAQSGRGDRLLDVARRFADLIDATCGREAGKKPGTDIKIVSVDGVKDAFTAMSQGKINFDVECNPLLGDQLAKALDSLRAEDEFHPRLVLVGAVAMLGKDAQDGDDGGEQVVRGQELGEREGGGGQAAQAAADQHLETAGGNAIRQAQAGYQADVVNGRQCAAAVVLAA